MNICNNKIFTFVLLFTRNNIFENVMTSLLIIYDSITFIFILTKNVIKYQLFSIFHRSVIINLIYSSGFFNTFTFFKKILILFFFLFY